MICTLKSTTNLHHEATRESSDGTFDKETSELVSSDKQELLVQQLEALKELSLKLNPQEL